MADETKRNAATPGDPKEAEPGRGAPGDQWAVQTAQTVGVNAKDEVIPSNADVNRNVQNIKAQNEQEDGTGISTTHGYTLDEAGQLNNFAVEPPMYVEED
ncbi:hypothetical protein IQ268_15145 [Oculatella sp. LEGE 06141]|uniref:hypothetical protein n=1 Tax=Oculatella sp. LEGE 06141 TaxID=1828648 RepID=UPI0018826E83|nr:hypothetical protein [Oculatella sp. LEGE 06141]MBE9179906.1 hypothetical protein [Oculatella sp. LEGE 06141]